MVLRNVFEEVKLFVLVNNQKKKTLEKKFSLIFSFKKMEDQKESITY